MVWKQKGVPAEFDHISPTHPPAKPEVVFRTLHKGNALLHGNLHCSAQGVDIGFEAIVSACKISRLDAPNAAAA